MPRPDPPGHRAKRSLGQNFLIDPNIQRRIVEAIEPSPEDEILEIGPGLGALTRHLAGRVRRLVLVELDDDLAARLRMEYADAPDVVVVHGDILEVPLEDLSDQPATLKVIGNIPYNITTPIIFHLLERAVRPAAIVLMVQKEVADRLLAPPGSRTYGALAIGVQSVADVSRVLQVRRGAFRPTPDVDSTVIRIVPRSGAVDPTIEPELRTLTRVAFGQRRKQFQKILRDAYHLDAAGIQALEVATGFDLRARPETFSPDEFIRLARALEAHPSRPGGLRLER
jgi:16S rRNA (adenine1518-N6/adenine1519-N6)-dimethyltransferase